MYFFKKILTFSIAVLLTNIVDAMPSDTLALSNALQSNMVVQQNKPFKIWGWAKAGETIAVNADWTKAPISTKADDNGTFLAIIDVPIAKRGDYTKHRIKVTSASKSILLDNLLIGDVWFCSGQSNMQFTVKEMLGADKVLSDADQRHIRLLNVALNFSAAPIDDFKGSWQECSQETVRNFSAVGYTFGKKLYDELDIPIGLVFSGIGASGVQAYIPQADLAADELLNSSYLQPYLNSPKSKEKINGGFSFEKVMRPFLLYNAMINPLVNLSIKGFCWYQGEANHLERESYTHATQTMITSWRRNFGQGQLPFYYVQIAPFFHDKEDPSLAFDAYFREAQEKIADLNNTFMVSTMDVGEAKDLHPKNKKPIGERLAAVALNRAYGKLETVYQGPKVDEVIVKKNKAAITFEKRSIGGGLQTNDGAAPKFFSVAGKDKIFYPAAAKLQGNKILLTNKAVKHIAAVRYAFFNYPVTNLENKEGFPALPFRTDNWSENLKSEN